MPSSLVRMLCLVFLALLPAVTHAGGAWVPAAGDGDIQLGFSRKTADTSWSASGDSFANFGRYENHDFRYTYLSGEVGVLDRLSFHYLVTWLDGREGPDGDLHQNEGWSDAWIGLKYALRQGTHPMALKLTVRTPILYDMAGPYSLELYDDDGEFIGLSPEWRGVLKHDVTLSYLWSRSLLDHRGWLNVETGYTWREGAPADQWPIHIDIAVPFSDTGAWRKLRFMGTFDVVKSLGNDSARTPSDRFGSRSTFNFNDASMARVAASLLWYFGPGERCWLEAGYGVWVWGRSARQYEEPYISIGTSF